MNAVGVFAGRGDVVLAMGMALCFGALIGWHLHRFAAWIKNKQKG